MTISVLLAVRDGQRHLDAAIRSILVQTHEDFELIVLDDGSRDSSGDIARDHARRDPRVRVVGLAPIGLPAALNRGLELTGRPWIARMDADDLCAPQRLERQLAAAERHSEVVGWATWARAMSDDGRIAGIIPRGPTTFAEFARQHARGPLDLNGASVLLRRSAVVEVGGYDPRFDHAEDIELYDRLGELGPILTVPEPLYDVRVRSGGHWMAGLEQSLRVRAFIVARRVAASQGRTLTFERFLDAERRAPAHRRLARRRQVLVRAAHHRATVRWVEGRRLAALAGFVPVGLLAPGFLLSRVRHQLAIRRG